jgi:NAD kinase
MILPDTMDIRILVPKDSRSTAWVSFDGRHRVHLQAGDSIQIKSSQFPVPTVCQVDQSEDWFGGLESCLAWNKREKQKAFE